MRQHAFRLLASLASVALVTFSGYAVFRLNATTVGFAYLLLVLGIASTWGFVEAALASIAATLTFNFFFLPPLLTFTIGDFHNGVAFVSFFTTSLIASRLSAQAKQREQDAIARSQDVERLYTFSRAILLIDSGPPFTSQLVQKLAEIFQLDAAVLFEPASGQFYRAGPSDFDGLDAQLRDAAAHGTTFSDIAHKRLITAVRLGSEPIASLALQGGSMPDSVLQGIANLVAIGLERAKAQKLSFQIEAARQSDQLRTALIDAMAHEFKTPLTSIKAATTSLLEHPAQMPESSTELLKIADEEADHLKVLIEDSVEMARLDSGAIEVHWELTDPRELVNDVAASLQAVAEDRSMDIVCDHAPAAVALDRRLLKIALKQLLENALKYSPHSTPVTIRVSNGAGTLDVAVTDRGQGISEQELKHVFERFYRSPAVKSHIPGSGLGLSIAYSIMRAHHGDLTVTSKPGETTFHMRLPVHQEEKPS